MAHVITHTRPRSMRGASVFAQFRAAMGVWRQRRRLATLDAHLRADIGLSDRSIHAEAARPVWDVPRNWRI